MTDRAEGKERPAAGSGGVSWARRVRLWLVWFVGLNAVWLVLISAFVLEETLLGILASAVAATAAVAVGEQRPFRFRPRARWLLAAGGSRSTPCARAGWSLASPPAPGRPARAGAWAASGSSVSRFRKTPTARRPKPRLLIAGWFVLAELVCGRCGSRALELMLVHELASAMRTDDRLPRSRPPSCCAGLAPLIVFTIRAISAQTASSPSTSVARSPPSSCCLLAAGTGRQPFFDLAVVSAVLSFAGGLAYARFLERWL